MTLTAGFNDISLSREDVALIKNGQELIINNKEAGYYSLFDSLHCKFLPDSLKHDCVLKVKRLMSTQELNEIKNLLLINKNTVKMCGSEIGE